MTRAKHFIISFLFVIPLIGVAQVQPIVPVKDTAKPAPVVIVIPPPIPPAPDSNIKVFEQPVVRNTVQKIYDYQRYCHGASPGFRVQIDFSQERNTANNTKSNFTGKYPGIPSYITYKQPYFRVSVGDFRSRLDAIRFLNEVKRDYPASFVVNDKITPPPL
ncbi:MAG TPA: SPOR domain-containing protein [Bacteroidia bacterium]|jgi:hypothetical protein|nr:SPOR domain-containing protein [Bacteroidia bacterium]